MQKINAAEIRRSVYDALIVLFYGGPESADQIDLFLDRLFQGKPVSPAARHKGKEKYMAIGGKSPIMEEVRRFVNRLQEQPVSPSLKIYSACLYTHPLIENIIHQAAEAGHRSVLIFTASPFGSQQSCGRYRTRIAEAIHLLPQKDISFQITVPYYDHPKWIRAESDLLLSLLAETELETLDWNIPGSEVLKQQETIVLFSAHSLPEEDGIKSYYREQLETAAGLIAAASGIDSQIPWNVVFQSRSGRPDSPWLGPDIQEFIRSDKEKHPNRKHYLILPFGFFFDNLETSYDLDLELAPLAAELRIKIKRAPAAAAAEKSVDFLLDLLSSSSQQNSCTDPENCRLFCKKQALRPLT